ncbi:MAG: hypothetical protein CSB33_05695 [Desulfobacterales bacterium]|nr:MAG: hypothetical protein CSB33_05695 [Desulfobacterales bacterium]
MAASQAAIWAALPMVADSSSREMRYLGGIADSGRQQQQGNARWQVDHDLFPDHAPFGIAHKMSFIQHHQVN